MSLRVFVPCAILGLVALPVCAQEREPLPFSFRNQVMAVFSRAGCNMGTCHGNFNGKNGFRLSLRGENPAFDLDALTRDTQGRRVNLIDPSQSLVLLKPTGQIPHEGGVRFGVDSDGDGRVDAYANPGAVAASATVLEARVWLRLRALEFDAAPLPPVTFDYAGRHVIAPADHHRRLLVATTVHIRNATR